jgi:type VI secretion system protein ImpL
MIVYVATALVFLVYLVAVWLLSPLLGIQSRDLWILRGGLGLIGLTASVVFVWFHIKISKQKAAAAGTTTLTKHQGSNIDDVLREAEARLKSSKLGPRSNLKKLPVVLILGDLGTSKTSCVLHSGLEAELLAGQVYEDKTTVPIPTRSANIWYAKSTAFLEASSKTSSDAGLWTYLLKRLQPGKFSALKGGHAARAAVVCFSCETFVQPSGNLALAAAPLAVQHIRTSLEEVARVLGISFPVYVLFTKADRIPFFAEFTRNLSNDEASQVLGVTLPLHPNQDGGVYAEQEAQRLSATFNNLVLSLADKRPGLLAREHDSQKLGGIYEFPRELRKLRLPIVQFLTDICKPSQLRATPFLRGFYFSGVRPVFVNEVAQPTVHAKPATDTGFNPQTDATRMFRADSLSMQSAIPKPQVIGSRKVPQWTFLTHFFSDVLLQDRLALAAATSSVKTSSLRQILLAVGAALCFLLSIAFVISYLGNRALESEVAEASLGVASLGSTTSTVPLSGALEKLETLRQSVEKLSVYRRNGAPWHLRWGLYVGAKLNDPARRLYFKQFHNLLFGSTQTALLDFLRNLPATNSGGDDYGLAYDSLKAYLITTSNHDKSSAMFLSPILLRRWSAGRNPDAGTMALAQKQFDFYGDELKDENPFSSENDARTIERSRRYLSQFAGTERVYQFMLTEASRKNPAVNFNRQFSGSAAYVIDNRDMPGAYTKAGWVFMQDAIKNADRFFSGEQWVLGEQGTSGIDRTKLEQQLSDRFTADYISQWQQFLRSAAVAHYGGLKDAAAKLNMLSSNQSPLLQLFCMVSQNTGVENVQIKDAFQSVQLVTPPPACSQQLIGESNSGYMQSLLALGALLEQIGNTPGVPNPALAEQAIASALQAKVITRQLAQKFKIDPQNHSEAIVQKLMEDPVILAELQVRNAGPAELTGKARAFCSQLSELANRFPFNSNATRQATLQELNSIFQPGQGAFWMFYETNLKSLLERRGGQFAPKEGSPIAVSATFLTFWNRAASFADAMYADGSLQPRMVYTLKPYRAEGIDASLTIDGKTITTSGQSAPQPFVWTGSPSSEVKLSVTSGQGGSLAEQGPWALFQFVADANKSTPIPTGYAMEWNLIQSLGRGGRATVSNGQTAIRFDLEGKGASVFQKNVLSGCVSEVTR